VRLEAGRSVLVAACAMSLGMMPSTDAAPFKEVAQGARTLVVAGCHADRGTMISCEAREAWRGKPPEEVITIPLASWRQWRLAGLETRPEARFVIVAGPIGASGCVLTPTASGLTLGAVGHVITCVLPLLDDRLPVEFRPSYDGSRDPPLPVERLKADLLAPTRTPFVLLARHSECAGIRNRLFVIDESLVFWERVGLCPDNSHGATLFGDTVDDILCSLHDSIAGPLKSCRAPAYSDMFETIIAHHDRPDLGLGRDHTVRPLPF